jgi:L-seryl-tRNA(Ser) seleniumtransferase/D-glucosaminate-6-phosphate ammonia-lyase
VYTYERLGVPRIINASGKMTRLGGSALAPEVRQALAEAGAAYVELDALKVRAGEVIAGWADAEAGWVTSGAAAGIAVMTAACVAGTDAGRVRRLPQADWEPRSILVQAGHLVDFGAPVEQMVRLGGGRPVAVGAVNRVTAELWRTALDGPVAAALYVQSHHCVQTGMLPLAEMIAACRGPGVPILVDAAAEEDLRRYVALGADLVTYSGGKAFEGPTSGFVVGRAALVAACRAQERGIARAMKVGKESILALLTALEAYLSRDAAAEQARQAALVAELRAALGSLPHTRVSEIRDEAGRDIVRVAVSPDSAALGFSAADLAQWLAGGQPAVMVRAHRAAAGTIALDPRPLNREEVPVLVEAIRAVYRKHAAG